jgi:ATP-dependent RNA circularization protein (DNA/RNA ligase family)
MGQTKIYFKITLSLFYFYDNYHRFGNDILQIMAFAISEFTATTQLESDISLTQSAKEAFTKAINQLDHDRLHINVADTKIADDIRKTNNEIKTLTGK